MCITRHLLCLMLVYCFFQTECMDHCGSHAKRRRHDSEHSGLEYTDLEAAEALVCMSSWGQSFFLGSNRPNPCKPRPLTPASDSCDSLLPSELPEPSKDFVSLSSLVIKYYTTNNYALMWLVGFVAHQCECTSNTLPINW